MLAKESTIPLGEQDPLKIYRILAGNNKLAGRIAAKLVRPLNHRDIYKEYDYESIETTKSIINILEEYEIYGDRLAVLYASHDGRMSWRRFYLTLAILETGYFDRELLHLNLDCESAIPIISIRSFFIIYLAYFLHEITIGLIDPMPFIAKTIQRRFIRRLGEIGAVSETKRPSYR